MSASSAPANHPDYSDFAELFSRFAALDPADRRREKWRDELIRGHMVLAEHIARRFRHRGIAEEDLRQVAMLGLVNAVDRYDPSRGNEFLSFAIPTIMGEVRRHFRDVGWLMKVPRRLKDLHLHIGRAINELSQSTGTAPTPRQIADHLGIDVQQVYDGLEASHAYQARSLDQPAPTDPERPSFSERLGSADPALKLVEDRQELQLVLSELPERKQEILIMRFFENMTQTEIGHRIGISQMQVSRLLSSTLAWLRERMEQRPIDE
jgi:RNA polymerase sigma-B factor